MINRFVISISILLVSWNGMSQLTQKNYVPLKCVGEIPAAFLETAEEKYKKRAGTISTNDDKRTQKNKQTEI